MYISGNFDVPFSATILEILGSQESRGYIVLEISSFMTHATKSFQPDYTIFTNFKPDHQNWHRDLQEYLDAKMNLVHATTKKTIINQQVIGFAEEK